MDSFDDLIISRMVIYYNVVIVNVIVGTLEEMAGIGTHCRILVSQHRTTAIGQGRGCSRRRVLDCRVLHSFVGQADIHLLLLMVE
jgi:hypothetical protein